MRKFLLCIISVLYCISFSVSVYAENKLPILMYHNITEDASLIEDASSVQITPEVFEEHIVALKEAGYTSISLKEYYDHCTNGVTLPEKPVIITFDDGYISNYKYAYPILKNHGQKAVIFVITSRMGATDVDFHHFTWEEAAEMENSGYIEIESHSHNHPDFSVLSNFKTILEMRVAKYLIETNLKKECKFFAYPYGKINSLSSSVAKLAGYHMAFVGGDEAAGADIVNSYEVPRYTVHGTYSGEELISLIQ